MELITPSGGLLFWMVLVFAIVFFILAKFGFPAITGMVAKRQDHINASLKEAQEAQETVAAMKRDCEKMLEETRVQQAALLEEAKAASARIIEQARQDADIRAESILKKARENIQVMKHEAIDEVKGEVIYLAAGIAEKLMRKQLSTPDAQQELISKMIEEAREYEQRNNS